MPCTSSRRTPLALALTLALAGLPSLAFAAPRMHREVTRETHASMVTQAWSFLQHLWGAEGMLIDPDGRQTVHAVTHVSGAEGMSIDPDGARRTATSGLTHLSGDSGMSIDPDGSH
jgi:hypothetical protein